MRPGDLFSTVGPEYWDRIDVNGSIGEKAYIRTNVPADRAPDGPLRVYRLEIVRDVVDVELVVEWPKCPCGGVAVSNASDDITRTCIKCGAIVRRL